MQTITVELYLRAESLRRRRDMVNRAPAFGGSKGGQRGTGKMTNECKRVFGWGAGGDRKDKRNGGQSDRR